MSSAACLGPVQVWNPGVANQTWGLGATSEKKHKAQGKDGNTVEAMVTKRAACLQYIVEQMKHTRVLGLVDCVIHEEGVENLEVELQAVVDCSETPFVKVRREKSHQRE